MVKNSLVTLLMLLTAACGNEREAPAAAFRAQLANRWHAKEQASQRLKSVTDYAKPRIVRRGAKPEIIVKGEQLFIAGKSVAIGQPIEIWGQAIPGKPRCDGARNAKCDWDDLGITLLVEGGAVKQFEVHFNLDPWWPQADKLPDGTPDPPPPDTRPKHPFPGYFEWDGYAIDANTRFWEIRASVDPSRNVRCDLLTNHCGNTTAHFTNSAKIYLELYQTIHENGKLASFAIAR